MTSDFIPQHQQEPSDEELSDSQGGFNFWDLTALRMAKSAVNIWNLAFGDRSELLAKENNNEVSTLGVLKDVYVPLTSSDDIAEVADDKKAQSNARLNESNQKLIDARKKLDDALKGLG